MPDSDSLNLIPSTQLTNPPILTPSVMAITTFPGHHNPSHNVCFHYGTSCDLCLDHGALTTAPLCLPAAAPSVASPRPALPVFSSSSHGLYKIKLDFQPPTMLKPGSLTPTPTRPRYVDRVSPLAATAQRAASRSGEERTHSLRPSSSILSVCSLGSVPPLSPHLQHCADVCNNLTLVPRLKILQTSLQDVANGVKHTKIGGSGGPAMIG